VDVAIDILNCRPVNSGGQMGTVPEIPDLLAVYSSDLDSDGHSLGPHSPQIAEHDRQLGRLIQATKDVGIYRDTAFVLTSDHGSSGRGRRPTRRAARCAKPSTTEPAHAWSARSSGRASNRGATGWEACELLVKGCPASGRAG
jgi:hypothetical protein